MGKLTELPLGLIRENPVALRAVNRQDEKYLGLVESIKSTGVLNAITVRSKTDEETGQEYFELIDGLHRFCASKDAGQEKIPANVLEMDDAAVLDAQVIANIHKVETKPVEYSRQMLRILAANPMMVESELAAKLSKSTQWVKERLGLTKIIDENIVNLINEGKIILANATTLAKLPPEEMAAFVDRAMTQGAEEFIPACNARLKEIREAKRQGKDAEDAVFQPVAFMQKMKDIKEELDKNEIGKILCQGLKTPEEGFAMAVKWALHLDPKSIEAQVAKDEERKKQRAEAKRKKDQEKAEKKAKKAAEAAAEAEAAAKELAKSNANAPAS